MSKPADYYDMSRMRPEVSAVLDRINVLGREKFVHRAAGIDIDATFPVENYNDLAAEGFHDTDEFLRNLAAMVSRLANMPWSAQKLPNIAARRR